MSFRIPVDYDGYAGVVARWIRSNAAPLAAGLILVGTAASTLGYVNAIPGWISYGIVILVDTVSVVAIYGAFRVIARVSASGTTEATGTASVAVGETVEADEDDEQA